MTSKAELLAKALAEDSGTADRRSWGDMLAQTWPAKLGQALLGGVTAPGDAWSGDLQMVGPDGRTSTEAIDRSADLAGLVMGGTYAGAPAGAVGSGAARMGAGGKWNPLDNAEVYKQLALDKRNAGHGNSTMRVFNTQEAIDKSRRPPTEWELALEKAKFGWKSAKEGATEEFSAAVKPPNPLKADPYWDELALSQPMGLDDRFRIASGASDVPGLSLGSGATDARSAAMVAGLMADKSGAPQGIRAYHGSPHDFDRFDLSKIGTGEGAQAYGHGLYFAEKEGVAQSYRDILGGRGNVYVGGKQLPNRPSGNVDLAAKQRIDDAARSVSAGQSVPESALNKAIEYAEYMRGKGKYAEAHANDVVAKLQEWQSVGLKTPQPGRMYEVDINAKPEQFLDWDKPPSGQAPHIRSAIDDVMKPIASDYSAHPDLGARRFQSVFYDMAHPKATGSPANASAALREAGIPGIKYLDQGSRRVGAGSTVDDMIAGLIDSTGSQKGALKEIESRISSAAGTQDKYRSNSTILHDAQAKLQGGWVDPRSSNYVVFDDSLIDILRKYGLAGAAPSAAVLAEALARQEQQPQ